MEELTAEQIKSFWGRVDILTQEECWKWTKGQEGKDAPIGRGYGVVWFNSRRYKTHRLAYEISTGEELGKQLACHSCDNPPCCNPSHIYAGNHKRNTADCRARGRFNREMGSKRYNAILTEEQVAIIKAEAPHRTYGWGRKIAKRFGVTATAINNIVMGRRWKQI